MCEKPGGFMEALQNHSSLYNYQSNLFNSADYMLLEETLAHFTPEGAVSFQSEVQPQDLHIEIEKSDDCVIL